MTGYTVHTGSTDKFSNGWDQIFKKKTAAKKSPPKAATTPAKTVAKKKGKK